MSLSVVISCWYLAFSSGVKISDFRRIEQEPEDFLLEFCRAFCEMFHLVKGVAEVVQDGSLVGECSMETVGEFQEDVLDTGLAQSDCVIIRQCGLTDGYMIQQIEGQIRNGIPVTSIWIFNGQDVRPLLDTEG